MGKLSIINNKTSLLKEDLYALYLSVKDPRTSILAKAGIVLIIAYVIVPTDLVPDFIPFFGWIDDLLILTLGFQLVQKLIPGNVWKEAKIQAEPMTERIRRVYKMLEVGIFIFWTLVVLSFFALLFLIFKFINTLLDRM